MSSHNYQHAPACARGKSCRPKPRSTPLVALVLLLVAGTLVLAGPAGAAPSASVAALPFLSRPDGEHYAGMALARNRNLAWRARAGGAIRCRQRINHHHLRCQASWAVGDAYFWGAIRVWYQARSDGLWWNYAYKVTMLDDYCYQVQHKTWRQCTRTFRGR